MGVREPEAESSPFWELDGEGVAGGFNFDVSVVGMLSSLLSSLSSIIIKMIINENTKKMEKVFTFIIQLIKTGELLGEASGNSIIAFFGLILDELGLQRSYDIIIIISF